MAPEKMAPEKMSPEKMAPGKNGTKCLCNQPFLPRGLCLAVNPMMWEATPSEVQLTIVAINRTY